MLHCFRTSAPVPHLVAAGAESTTKPLRRTTSYRGAGVRCGAVVSAADDPKAAPDFPHLKGAAHMTLMESEVRRKYERSHITDEERRAIDAAVQAGRIQRIPRGVSGYTVEDVVWCQQINRLRSVDPDAAKRAYSRKGATSKRRAAPESKAVAANANAKRAQERKATVARAAAMYTDDGMTVAEIAAALVVHPDTAKLYLRHAGLQIVHGQQIERARRDERIAAMNREGQSARKIAAALGINPKTVRNIIGKGIGA